MHHLIYGVILLVAGGIFAFSLIRKHRALANARREQEEIEVEEQRMFEFLHGLGESLQEDNSRGNLHRYIVEGVTKVVGAESGILYVFDHPKRSLVPIYQTGKTIPVIPLPSELLAVKSPEESERQLRNFVRLSSLKAGDSFVGNAFQNNCVISVEDMTEHPLFEGHSNPFQSGVSLLVAPLVYGQKKLGVLAVAHSGEKSFSSNARDVFESVTEQSAFALGTAIIHADSHEKQLLERELKQASEIQMVLLPRESPQLSDFDVAACYRPARLVSGDYYDYIKIDDDHYGVAIGDVCGKGIAASLIMAMCRSLLRSSSVGNLSPAAVLDIVNQSIFPDIKQDMFVSLLYLILERGSHNITLARAGHEPPLLLRSASGEVETIEPQGLAAGIDRGNVFRRVVKDFRFTMEPGDILTLYTDGLIEATNPSGDEFGIEGLTKLISGSADKSPREIVDFVEESVSAFSDGSVQNDDITLIAVKKR